MPPLVTDVRFCCCCCFDFYFFFLIVSKPRLSVLDSITAKSRDKVGINVAFLRQTLVRPTIYLEGIRIGLSSSSSPAMQRQGLPQGLYHAGSQWSFLFVPSATPLSSSCFSVKSGNKELFHRIFRNVKKFFLSLPKCQCLDQKTSTCPKYTTHRSLNSHF